MGRVVSVNMSREKGTMKRPLEGARLVAGAGILGDSHSEPGERAISLMRIEDIQKSRDEAPAGAIDALSHQGIEIGPGAYAENITTEGLDFSELAVGDILLAGQTARLRVTKFGKSCHHGCEIRNKLGDCIFPRVGIFAEVVEGGTVRPGDEIEKG